MDDLVLIPGLGSDAAIWSRTIAALGEDVRCSVGNTLLDDTLPGMAQRILEEAPATFALAGVSMGGMVALEFMRMAPKRVSRETCARGARPALHGSFTQALRRPCVMLSWTWVCA